MGTQVRDTVVHMDLNEQIRQDVIRAREEERLIRIYRAVDLVRDMHRMTSETGPWPRTCRECGKVWPCPTAEALDL